MSEKLISIIMPVMNAEEYVYDSVQSILSQTYKNFELFIIIDDGSTDKTLEIVETIKDERIKLFIREGRGFIEQLNFGLQEARGEFIARMDADDIAFPEKLELQVNFLLNNPDIKLVGTNFYFVDEKGKILAEKKLPEKSEDIEFMMPFIDSISHPTILTYKEILFNSGGYNIEYRYAEDDELFLRLLSLGFKMYNIQKPLYKYRLIDKPYEYYEKQNSDYYKCGFKYLENYYEEKNGDYYFRLGLLEYYRGSIKKARENFLRCLKFKNIRKKIILRYLMVTFLGSGAVNFLRKKKITPKLNSYIYKNFNYDTYNLEGAKIKK
jgi:glycosyltransferase involved in cell wall biosynthesis